jgi:hypothetical protein
MIMVRKIGLHRIRPCSMKIVAASLIVVVVLALRVLPPLSADSTPPVYSGPAIAFPVGATSCPPTCYSYSWSGYFVSGPKGSVTDVKGSWTVPTYTGALCNVNEFYFVSITVYIADSKTAENPGIAVDCYEGVVYYWALTEFWTGTSGGYVQITSMTIHPGDIISAEVKYLGSGKFTESVTDVTTKQSYSKTATVSGATETTAAWIVQPPNGPVGLFPLADFGTVYWGSDNTATVSGHTAPIGAFATVASVESVCYPSGLPLKAVPSALSSDKSSFSVQWYNLGPEG